MLNKKIMVLAIFLVSLLAVSAVSAQENATSDVVSVDNNDDIIKEVNDNDVIEKVNNDSIQCDTGVYIDFPNEILVPMMMR